jgi:hypothetical protein
MLPLLATPWIASRFSFIYMLIVSFSHFCNYFLTSPQNAMDTDQADGQIDEGLYSRQLYAIQ